MSSQHRQPPATSSIELFSVIFPFFFRNIRSLRKTCISILTWTLLGNVNRYSVKTRQSLCNYCGNPAEAVFGGTPGAVPAPGRERGRELLGGRCSSPAHRRRCACSPAPSFAPSPRGNALVAMETWRPREVECNDPTAAEHRGGEKAAVA